MVTNDIEKNRAAMTITRTRAQRRISWNSPVISPLLRWTTGVRGAIQLRVCTIPGNEVSGKNTPLKKNIGVINRVKK